MCEVFVRCRQVTKLIDGSALLVQGPNGLVKNPSLVIQCEAEATFAAIGARLGLTPSGRSRLKVERGGSTDTAAPTLS